MMLRAYREWVQRAGLDEQTERAARRILADTQINVGYFFVAQDAPYEEWFAEVTQADGFRPEHLEWLKRLRDEPVSVGTIDDQALSRLRKVVTPEQLDRFEQIVGSPFAFANMAPFDIPTPGFIGEHIVTADRRYGAD